MPLAAHRTCDVCLRACRIASDARGFCGIREHAEGEIRVAEEFAITEAACDAIEKKPLFHFQPGTRVYSLGGWGCTLHCRYCRNWEVACMKSRPAGRMLPSLEVLKQEILKHGCSGVVWTHSEPTLWYEAICSSSERLSEANIANIILTNGAASRSVYAQLVSSGVKAWKIDLKGFSKQSFEILAGFPQWEGILDNIAWLREQGGHVELSYCPVPTVNDSEEEVRELGKWVVSALGPDTPVHLQAYFPAYKMTDVPFSGGEVLLRLRQLLKQESGLHHVYVPLSLDPEERATYCATCGHLLAGRSVFGLSNLDVSTDGRCPSCHSDIPFVMQEPTLGVAI